MGFDFVALEIVLKAMDVPDDQWLAVIDDLNILAPVLMELWKPAD